MIKLDYKYKWWIETQLNQINEPIKAAIIGGDELMATNINFNSAMKVWVNQLYKRKMNYSLDE